MPTNRGVILSLCDLTGHGVKDWVENGYDAILVDPQHTFDNHCQIIEIKEGHGIITRVDQIIDHPMTWRRIRERWEEIVFVAAYPPCTDVAVSGARWFEEKAKKDPHFQTKAALIAEQCRTIGNLLGVPWFFENPVSVFSSIFGKAQYTFDPYQYGGYLPEDDVHPEYPEYIAPRDAYPKTTNLWTSRDFVMPPPKPVEVPEGYSTQYNKLGGKSDKTKNIRSATPRGISKAIYLYNAPHLQEL